MKNTNDKHELYYIIRGLMKRGLIKRKKEVSK